MKKLITFILAFLLFSIHCENTAYAQTCDNNGVECCTPLYQGGPCGGDTYPGDCDGSCNANCGGGVTLSGSCSWSGGSTPCFPAGTGITLEDGTSKVIEDVQVGDKVMSQDENGNKTVSTVQKLIQPISDNMCTIGFDDGETLEVTKAHPFLTDDGWKAIDRVSALSEKPGVDVEYLKVGDNLYKENGEKPIVTSISCRSENVQVYNFTVDNSHTYFANGFLAHNKGNPGECWNGSVNCPPSYAIATNQPISTFCDKNEWGQTMCAPKPGSAQRVVGSCCSGENCINDKYTTYNCCPSGSVDTPQTIYGGTYTKEIGCLTGNGSACNDADDIVVDRSLGAGAGVCYCTEDCKGPVACANRLCPNAEIRNDIVTCQSVTYTGTCVPTCTQSAPSAPTLTAPAPCGGSTIMTTNPTLSWNTSTQTWGTNCAGNTNTYQIYINGASIGTVPSTTGSVSSWNGTSGQTYTWKVVASNGALSTPSLTCSFTINSYTTPWWQVKDGDVTTTGGLTSKVPTITPIAYFNTVGLGGFPGVPVYGGSFNLTGPSSEAKISTLKWNAGTSTSQSKVFNYSFFKNLIPDDVVFNDVSAISTGGSTYTDGYEWFKAIGDVSSVGDINIGNRKVILFIENGNLNINGKINVTDGVGFFGAFVNGSISVEASVAGSPALEGIYLSDGSFSSGAGTSQLHVRGSIASFGGVNLQRDLAVDSSPAELFEFAPDQMLLFPEKLMFRRTKWTEIAP